MKNEEQNQLIHDLFLLQRVAQRLNANLDLDALLTEIVNDVSQTFGCSRLAVFLKDDETNELVVGADCGGEARLRDHLANSSVSAQSLLNDVRAFAADHFASDDVTAVMMQACE